MTFDGISPELLSACYAPQWNPVAARPLDGGTGIERVLVVGHEADTASAIRQLSGSPLFAATRFEHISSAAGKFEHVLLIAPAPHGVDLKTNTTSAATALFELVKGMMRGTKSARFVHLVPAHGNPYRPEYLALSGFYRTLRIERPGYVGRVVYHDSAELHGEAHARMLFDEFRDSGSATDVTYREGVRLVREFYCPHPRAGAAAGTFREGGVYLITGGLGAIGQIVAGHLSRRYRATVYLTGRSALSDRGSRDLDAIASLGGEAHYIACDVAHRDQVHQAIASIHEAGHLLNGVLHCAGVIEDGFIIRKTTESFERVVAPKVSGTYNLDEETCDEPLDCFVLFSSVSATLGNLGQCDYSFGNSFQDYFAHARRTLVEHGKRRGQTLSVNWPLWKEGGMRLTEKEEAAVRRNFGIVPLETAEGLAALEYGLAQKLAQKVVMPGDAAKVAEVLGVVASPVHHDGSNARVAPAAGDVGANDCVISAGSEPTASDCVVSAGNGSGAGSDDLIAIIGLSGRYPQAETLEEFWDNLKLGRDCIVEVPKDRWDVASHFQPGRPMPGKTYGKWG